MLAIIKTGGKQYKVQPGDKIKVERLLADEGQTVLFNEVLLGSDEKSVYVGQPLVEGAKVEAKVVRQMRAPKVTTIKHHAKKRYKTKQGHRQLLTEVEIGAISLK